MKKKGKQPKIMVPDPILGPEGGRPADAEVNRTYVAPGAEPRPEPKFMAYVEDKDVPQRSRAGDSYKATMDALVKAQGMWAKFLCADLAQAQRIRGMIAGKTGYGKGPLQGMRAETRLFGLELYVRLSRP